MLNLILATLLSVPLFQDAPPRVVFLVGQGANGSEQTMPAFANELRKRARVDVTVLQSQDRGIPDLSALEGADLLVLYLRNAKPTARQLAKINAWFAAGKPVVALRTTSHAFAGKPAWFPRWFGGHYKAHAPDHWGTSAVVTPEHRSHPILRGVPRSVEMGFGGTYVTQPLDGRAKILMLGKTGERPAEPIAWTFAAKKGARVFYTSLGSREHFAQEAFRKLLFNACTWALGRGVDATAHGERAAVPPPPPIKAPKDAIVLFDGKDLSRWQHWDPSVEPVAVEVDKANATKAEAITEPHWAIEGRTVVAAPGRGDLLSRQRFGNYELHLDFFVPEQPEWMQGRFRGASGVYLGGRHEIQIADSFGQQPSKTTCGALFGFKAPAKNAARKAGVWQSLDVRYQHLQNSKAKLRVSLNGTVIHDGIELPERTTYGFLEALPGTTSIEATPGLLWFVKERRARSYRMDDAAFTIVARFKTKRGGTLFAKCPPGGKWEADSKALFVRGGRLVYDIGWVGAITSKRPVGDGKWHTAVLTHVGSEARLYVDGELEAQRKNFSAKDRENHICKIGAAATNFGGAFRGRIEAVQFDHRKLDDAEARELSALKACRLDDPQLDWRYDPKRRLAPTRNPAPVLGPIRLQADTAAVRFANIWVRPLATIDHAKIIAALNQSSYRRGEAYYKGMCVSCHGLDGRKTTNPNARPFATGKLENGNDPYSMWRTLTHGYKTMPAQEWLPERRRYDVVHYLREHFFKTANPSQYAKVDAAYLKTLPKPLGKDDIVVKKAAPRDYGPALAAQLGRSHPSALTIDLGAKTAIGFDTHTMRVAGVWRGRFLNLANTQHYKQRGEGIASMGERPIPGFAWQWAIGGRFDVEKPLPRGPVPRDWLDYHGHYVHGRSVVLSYRVGEREVLDAPRLVSAAGEPPVIAHTLRIAPGDAAMQVCAGQLQLGFKGMTDRTGKRSSRRSGDAATVLALSADSEALRRFVVAGVRGASEGLRWEVDDAGRLVLHVPPAPEPLTFEVLTAAGASPQDLARFVAAAADETAVRDPATLTHGGRRLFDATIVTRGELGTGSGAYVVDTLTLPETNPWNAWLRTSALACFEDGRIAVSTYGGDVWIVDGVDDTLDELRWTRFASGMFEPMGLQVVGGEVWATCRNGLVHLHDFNHDGAADFYETVWADTDVSATFHAFNFDLQRDGKGNFYYAKSGQFTSYALNGAVLRISPDGERCDVVATGLRTPNGMGILPDGRVLVSDNQGQWVPASKINLLQKPGAFFGVYKHSVKTAPTEEFDRPILWMPQDFDSSSGGQLWVDDDRWGPLSGHLLHTSFGKGWLFRLSLQDIGGVTQAGATRLPFQFLAGVDRLRVNPKDGQVYLVGISGWQGPAGGKDGCLQRVRYTGRTARMLLDSYVRRDGIELRFTCPLDIAAAKDTRRYSIEQWQYRRTRGYGSPQFKVSNPKQQGHDVARVREVAVKDSRTLLVRYEEHRPVQQLKLVLDVLTADGKPLHETVYMTIHHVPR